MLVYFLVYQVAPSLFLVIVWLHLWADLSFSYNTFCCWHSICTENRWQIYLYLVGLFPGVAMAIKFFFVIFSLTRFMIKISFGYVRFHCWFILYIVFYQEGRAVVENKTADIIQETCKLNIRRKGAVSNTQGEAGHKLTQKYLPQNPLDHETQLKASRDVRWQIGVTRYVASVLHFACLNPLYGKMSNLFCLAGIRNAIIFIWLITVILTFIVPSFQLWLNYYLHLLPIQVANAMAAKAKLLLRELKTVKADLAFAKERCAQLEEENKMLRESYDKGDNPEDDDLVSVCLRQIKKLKNYLEYWLLMKLSLKMYFCYSIRI